MYKKSIILGLLMVSTIPLYPMELPDPDRFVELEERDREKADAVKLFKESHKQLQDAYVDALIAKTEFVDKHKDDINALLHPTKDLESLSIDELQTMTKERNSMSKSLQGGIHRSKYPRPFYHYHQEKPKSTSLLPWRR